MKIVPVTLTGERVTLVPMAEEHAEGLFAAGNDPDLWTYMTVKQPLTLEEMQRIVAGALAEQAGGTALPFTIFDLQSGQIVGSTRLLDISVPHRQAEIGSTWLTPAVQRTRINTECKHLLLRHCFEALDFVRVQLKADARNTRSHRAMERIGAVREGVLRRHRILPDGFVRDTVYYSVIAEEWPATKAHLERLLSR